MSQSLKQLQQTPSSSLDPFLLATLLKNDIFSKLSIPLSQIKQISQNITLTKFTESTKISIDFEILLVVQGSVHQYIPNSFQNILKNLDPNLIRRELILLKKIQENGFYFNYHPKYDSNKSELVVQEGSVVIKIQDAVYYEYFQQKLQAYFKGMVDTLNNFDFIKTFKIETVCNLIRYLKEEKIKEGTVIYDKGMKSQYFYFIKSGSVELSQKKSNNRSTISLNNNTNNNSNNNNSKIDKFQYLLNSSLTRNQVFGYDGIITPTDGNRRIYSCTATSNSQLLMIQRRVLIILICIDKQNNISRNYHEINLTDQFSYKARKSQNKFNRYELKHINNNFRYNLKKDKDKDKERYYKNGSVIDLMKLDSPTKMINQTPELINYQSMSEQLKKSYKTASQFLPQSRISIIRMGNHDEEEDIYSSGYRIGCRSPTSPRKSLPMKKKSLTLLNPQHRIKASTLSSLNSSPTTKSKYRQQYRRQMQQLIQVKRLQQQNAKIKIVNQTKYDQRLKSTSRIKRILICSKPQSQQNVQDILFRKLQALNQNPLLLNFQNNRKRLLLQMKKSVSKQIK